MRSINIVLPSLLLIIFFIFLISNEAHQGIRLENGGIINPVEQLKNGNYNRKLLTAASPSSSPTPSTTRNEEEERKKKGKKDYSENVEAGLEHYPELVDIAEMDYSPAKRKPPIHN